jgi:hypothetical protein
MFAISVVVGAAGRRPGDLGAGIRRAFVGLTLGVLAVGAVVHAIVLVWA